MRTRTRVLPFLAAASVACSSVLTEGGLPTTVTLSADRAQAAVGETVSFRVEATGTSLTLVIVDFGDGAADTVVAFGSVTAASNRTHAYEAAGTYTAVARAEDAANPTARDSVTVEVIPPTGP